MVGLPGFTIGGAGEGGRETPHRSAPHHTAAPPPSPHSPSDSLTCGGGGGTTFAAPQTRLEFLKKG